MANELEDLEKGMKWRGALTGVIAVGWIAFLVAWLLVYAGDFDIYKNIAVVLGTLVLAIVAVMITWMSAFGGYMAQCGDAMKGVKGLSWRFGFSMVLFGGTIAFLLVWLWFFAGDFNGYQNLGLLILTLLGVMVAMWVTWATWNPGLVGDVNGGQGQSSWSWGCWSGSSDSGSWSFPCGTCTASCPMARGRRGSPDPASPERPVVE